jgi:hypothetical protein
MRPLHRRLLAVFTVIGVALTGGVHAQQEVGQSTATYKVIGQGGRISYVDKPSLPNGAKAVILSGHNTDQSEAAAQVNKYIPILKPTAAAPLEHATAAKPLAKVTARDAGSDTTPPTGNELQLRDAQAKLATQQCQIAKQNLSALSHGRVARYTSSGQRQFLSDSEIAIEKERSSNEIRGSCASTPE